MMLKRLPLFWLSLGLLAGILIAGLVTLNWSYWALLGLIFGAAACLEKRFLSAAPFLEGWRKVCPLPLAMVLAAVFAGAARYQAVQPVLSPADVAYYNGQGPVRLYGQVFLPPDEREKSTLVQVEVKQITFAEPCSEPAACTEPGFTGESRAVSGAVQAILLPAGQLAYGDWVLLEGKLIPPTENEDFSYREYLARQRIYSQINFPRLTRVQSGGNPLLALIYQIREGAHQIINQILPQPEAALLSGILLGIESDLPDSLQQAFQNTGTAHIIAISGFNIAILSGLFLNLAGIIFPRRRAWLAALTGICAYTLMVGAQASVVRAAIMGSLGVLGQQVGRKQSGINALTFCAALMAFANPLILGDVGFQLSFGATLGLVWFGDPFQRGLARLVEKQFPSPAAHVAAGAVGEYFLLTLAAQITTLPIIVFHFQRVSLISAVVNPLILPPQPLVMFLGGAAVLLGAIYLPVGRAAAALAWAPLAYTIRGVEWMAAGAQNIFLSGETWGWIIGGLYAVIFTIILRQKLARWLQAPWLPTAGLVLLGCLTLFIWKAALSAPDGRLHLVWANTANSPSLFIKAPDGKIILLGLNSSTRALEQSLNRRRSPFSQALDLLILDTPDGYHQNQLEDLFAHHPISQILVSQEILSSTSDSRNFRQTLDSSNTRMTAFETQQDISLGPEIRLTILRPASSGSISLLRWKNFRAVILNQISTRTLLKYDTSLWASPGALIMRGETNSNLVETCQLLHPLVIVMETPAYQKDLQDSASSNGCANEVYPSGGKEIEMITDGDHLWMGENGT